MVSFAVSLVLCVILVCLASILVALTVGAVSVLSEMFFDK